MHTKAMLRTIKRLKRAIRVGRIEEIYYGGIYAKKVLRSNAIVCDTGGRLELHTLACEKDLINSLWSLKTFYHFSGIRPKLVIYDDGSLSEAATKIFLEHFRNCRIIRRDRFHRDMEYFLKDYGTSHEYSRHTSFYCALKLFGPMRYTRSEQILYMDSDILFFQKPVEMLRHIDNLTPFFMGDYQDAYAYPVELLNNLLKIDLPPKINAGLFHIAKKAFADNMDFVESYFEKISELKLNGLKLNRHEQTLAAILLSKANAVRLSRNHQISKEPLTDKTISHHFVNDGSRPAFYTEGVRRLKSSGFIHELV